VTRDSATSKSKELTAYHEAGHVFAYYLCGYGSLVIEVGLGFPSSLKVTDVGPKKVLGYTNGRCPNPFEFRRFNRAKSIALVNNYILVMLGGTLGEIIGGKSFGQGRSDFETLGVYLGEHGISENRIQRIASAGLKKGESYKSVLDALVSALTKKKKLSGEEAANIVLVEIESHALQRLRDRSLDRIALQMHKAGASYREIGDLFEVDARLVSRAIRKLLSTHP
jgi:hypothetical protein